MGSSDQKDAVGESNLHPINMINSRENSLANTPRAMANLAVLNKTQPILTHKNDSPAYTKGVQIHFAEPEGQLGGIVFRKPKRMLDSNEDTTNLITGSAAKGMSNLPKDLRRHIAQKTREMKKLVKEDGWSEG